MSGQWKLVPVDPTETMVINGFESEPNECFTDDEVWEQYQGMSGCQQAAFRAKLCWAAMLGAAPAPPEATERPAAWLDPNSIQRGEILSAQAKKNSDFLGQQDRAARFSVPLYEHPDAAEVARLTAERDALQVLLTAADERADAGIAFVIRLIQCSEGQPSIATGYLRDILDVLKQTEGILTPTTCTWKFGAFSWQTACGQEWMLNDGTPEQNGMRFCHSCGNALVVEEPEDA